jgi:hypothetical protein
LFGIYLASRSRLDAVTASKNNGTARVQFVLITTDEETCQSAESDWPLERGEPMGLEKCAMLTQAGDVTPMRGGLPAGVRSPRIIGEKLSFAGLCGHHHLL